MNINIRRASAADASALTDLMQVSSTYESEYARILDGYRVTPEQISRDLIFLVEESGRLLGFYSLMLGEEPELDLMFVADNTQGTGVGRQLFEHMRVAARERGIPLVKIDSHPPSGAELIGTKPPSPPRVTWERPVLTLRTGPA